MEGKSVEERKKE
uniref:Uncharacterized protein n=1 Tax=Rhizophora mucronata TaxID=61149 RepID=A0A2P2Q9D0_RHIMU